MSAPVTNAPAASAAGADPAPRLAITLFDCVMLIVGTMIGSGIFVTSVAIAQEVGSAGWLLAVWGLAGFMTIIGALAYGELAAMMPKAGGQYVFLREAYSPLWGFLYGWTCFLVIQTGSIAFVAVVFAKYLGVLVPMLGTENVLYKVTGLGIELGLPWMTDTAGKVVPFFKLDELTVSAGHLVAVFVIAFLTALNCRGVKEGTTVQNLFTVAKTVALIGLIVVGLWVVGTNATWEKNMERPWDGIATTEAFKNVSGYRTTQWLGGESWLVALMVFGAATVGALFSADAWNNVTFTAGETKNPRRNVPLSLALGTGIVILLYLLANVAYVSSLPVQGNVELARQAQNAAEEHEKTAAQLQEAGDVKGAVMAREQAANNQREATFQRGIDNASEERLGTAVMELWSPAYAAPIMALAIMISTFGCVNGMTLMGARLYWTMARDNLFFRSVGTLNSRSVPAVALVLQGVWSSVLVFSGKAGDLLDYVIFAVLVFYALTVIGLFKLRFTRPNAERPYKAFGYPVLPAVYVLLCVVIMLDLLVVKPQMTWPGLIIVVAGIPVYFLWRLFHRRTTG